MPHSPVDHPLPRSTGLAVRPFQALTYRRHDPLHLARVSSPAYDLVTAVGRERLAETDPHNIVRLILPHVEAADPPDGDRLGGDGATRGRRSAETAAGTLSEWIRDGVLVRDREPALWRYEMAPAVGHSTTGWLAAVTLPGPGSAAVLPHEDTFAPAVEGRRALLAATGTDLEPIVLAHDPDEEVAALTRVTATGAPTLEVSDPDGVRHRLWRVTDPAVLAALPRSFAGAGAVIADGHHRFAAARAHQRNGAAHAGELLALLTPMGTGGLRLEAIHRVIPDLTFEAALASAAAGFTVRPITPPAGAAEEFLRGWPATARPATFLVTDGQHVAELSAPTTVVRGAVPTDAPAAWRRLDVVLAHHGLFQQLWGRTDEPSSVLVAHDVAEALRFARERAGVAVLLHAPSPADVAAVARAGARMPRKSTLFVPKPRTGLVLRPHDG